MSLTEERKILEWTPGQWWVVAVTDSGYALIEGPFTSRKTAERATGIHWPAKPTHPCSSTPALQWAKWYRVRRATTALGKLAAEYNGPIGGFDDACFMVLAVIDNGHRIPQLPSGENRQQKQKGEIHDPLEDTQS